MTTTALTHSMTEDELLTAITEAATLCGWLWTHHRRSDRAQLMGHAGFPDLVLAKAGRVLFFELKAQAGRVGPDQWRWLQAIDPDWPLQEKVLLVVRPANLDYVLGLLR